MLDIGKNIHNNRNKIIILFIILIILYFYNLDKIEKKQENINNLDSDKIKIETKIDSDKIKIDSDKTKIEEKDSEMYIPNCNFLTDSEVCGRTRGCKVRYDKCYYDWENLQ
jgi:hypothetical protein